MTPRRKWAVAWGAWVTAFAVMETITVRRRNDTALCNYLRPVLGVHGGPVHKAAGVGALVGFAVWFVPHLYRQQGEKR
ncbi:hypothetical protein ACFPA8_07860 [Streptomyces ovatisporus]|uniref:Integral membrane protein n=1 Tax=Streptomyces ovatisporus TaxID=1128682 RepID=A0ABV9A562_9ACTN